MEVAGSSPAVRAAPRRGTRQTYAHALGQKGKPRRWNGEALGIDPTCIMEYTAPPPGVPDASGPPTMTPPSHDELVMAGNVSYSDAPEDSTQQRPYQEYVRIHDPAEDEWRPAVICFPPGKGSSYCVLHTPADRPARVKKHTRQQYDFLSERTREWDAPQSVKRMVWQASGGSSQTAQSIRKAAEIEDCHVLSYVMRVVEEAEETNSHHADRIQTTLLRGETVT